ncbi:ParA family protein [Streptomyces sp. SM14]|uniref:ParA family protein n=1 Tax=Streptomyces sp. SM14 TaxID=1736045 RepID=UPI0015E17A39|nr:ParA family protein [Streptomyces sp. SM14]
MLDEDLPEFDRAALRSAYVFANGKGGVGKTTLTTNVGGLMAAAGHRVLLIDVNAQGNVGRDLGYRESEVDDQGQAFSDALLKGAALTPVQGIRPNLDVVIGGTEIGALPDQLAAKYHLQARRQALALAVSLAPIAPAYDVVLIDSAPENRPLQQLALAAARWMIAPTRSDRASINDGLGGISHQFAVVRGAVNPDLALLGVVLFAVGSRSHQIQTRAREWIAAELGTDAAVFNTVVRHSEAVGVDARDRGLLAHELEIAAADNPNYWEVRAGKATAGQAVSTTSASVAEDLATLTREIFTRAAELDAA